MRPYLHATSTWERLFCIRHPRKIWEKSTGEFLQNDFFNRVLAPGTYPAGFLLKNCADPTNQISICSSDDPIQAQFDVFLDFYRKKISHFSVRSSQLLLKPYNHLSIGLILPYRPSIHPTSIQHPHPTSTSPKIFNISFRYSQSLYKPYIRDSLVSSSPIGPL